MSDPERVVTWLRELVAASNQRLPYPPCDGSDPNVQRENCVYCTAASAKDSAAMRLMDLGEVTASLLADALEELAAGIDPEYGLHAEWCGEQGNLCGPHRILARAAESFPGTKEERG